MGKFIAAFLVVAILVVGVIDVLEPSGYGFLGKVGNGKVAVVTRFGKAQETPLSAGFHFKGFFDLAPSLILGLIFYYFFFLILFHSFLHSFNQHTLNSTFQV